MNEGSTYQELHQFPPEVVSKFAALTGDMNPVHLDQEYAKSTPFKEPICHGALAVSHFSKILATNLPGPGTIYLSQTAKFSAPIFVGEKIKFSVTITKDLGKGRYRLETLATKSDGIVAISGEAEVLWKKHEQ